MAVPALGTADSGTAAVSGRRHPRLQRARCAPNECARRLRSPSQHTQHPTLHGEVCPDSRTPARVGLTRSPVTASPCVRPSPPHPHNDVCSLLSVYADEPLPTCTMPRPVLSQSVWDGAPLSASRLVDTSPPLLAQPVCARACVRMCVLRGAAATSRAPLCPRLPGHDGHEGAAADGHAPLQTGAVRSQSAWG